MHGVTVIISDGFCSMECFNFANPTMVLTKDRLGGSCFLVIMPSIVSYNKTSQEPLGLLLGAWEFQFQG